MASVRLRAGALWMTLRGGPHRLTAGDVIDVSADVCVIGKIGAADTSKWQQGWMNQLSRFKGRIVLDFTDDHISHRTIMRTFYLESLRLAHQVVCSSRVLKGIIASQFAGPVTVIEDAIEVPVVPPRDEVHDPRRLLWFGHASNMPALLSFLAETHLEKPVELIALSNPQGLDLLHRSSLMSSSSVDVQMRIWSQAEMLRAAMDSDVCIIPVEQATGRKAGVSANRLLTALALGLPTAADMPDSYRDFAQYFADLRGRDFANLLRTPTEWGERVLDCQTHVIGQYSMKQLGEKWLSVLSN